MPVRIDLSGSLVTPSRERLRMEVSPDGLRLLDEAGKVAYRLRVDWPSSRSITVFDKDGKISGKAVEVETGSAAETPQIDSNQVSLIVTSPPFLNVVDYAGDNWLRCWFLGIDPSSVKMTTPRNLQPWEDAMRLVFTELTRVLKPGGHIAFEVGEVHGGKVRLEEAVIRAGAGNKLEPILLQINDQKFTKTANCWGVDNNLKGTNTNRLVIFRKV